jgi:hypothetical protein
VAPGRSDAPTIVGEVFDHHWYPVMLPLPAVAVTDKSVADWFRVYDTLAAEGCTETAGAAFIATATTLEVTGEPQVPETTTS